MRHHSEEKVMEIKQQVNAHSEHYFHVPFQKKTCQQQSTLTVSAIVRSDRINFDGETDNGRQSNS